MAKVLDYDFERPWWGNPVVNAIIGGVSVGGVAYATGMKDGELIVTATAPAIGTGGITHLTTKDKVFDKSGQGNDGVMKNDAHIENGNLVLDGVGDQVYIGEVPQARGSIELGIQADVVFGSRLNDLPTVIAAFDNWKRFVGMWHNTKTNTWNFSLANNGKRSHARLVKKPIEPGEKYRMKLEFQDGKVKGFVNGEQAEHYPHDENPETVPVVSPWLVGGLTPKSPRWFYTGRVSHISVTNTV